MEHMSAVRQAAQMRLIGLLFEHPRKETREQVDALAREIDDPSLRAIAERMRGLDEATYVGLFGPGGPVSPREVAYRRRDDPGSVMADAAAFYEAFAYRPRVEDPHDHVAVEAGFVGYLWLKEAYAIARGDTEAAQVTATARARFVEDHLSTLAGGLVERLRSVQAPDVLALAEALRERTGGRPASAGSEGESDDEELTCGRCSLGERSPGPQKKESAGD